MPGAYKNQFEYPSSAELLADLFKVIFFAYGLFWKQLIFFIFHNGTY